MKQGKKRFKSKTQGARTREGSLQGENFIKRIFEIVGIKSLDLIKENKFFNRVETDSVS